MATVQVDPFTASQPLQLMNRDPVVGDAVSVTTALTTKSLAQPAPQLMPCGLDVTVPRPMPVFATVSVKRFSMKMAVADRALVMFTVHVVPETASHPVHPVKVEVAAGAAVSVTEESLRNCAEQVAPQSMPDGADVTLPDPSPCRSSVRVSRSRTVTVVLPLLPNASDTPIVAVPRPTPVTVPSGPTVAMSGRLLVQVIPVACIGTGESEFVAVPLPNSPRSFSPQQMTEASGIWAQVCPMPSEIASGLATPCTVTGVAELVVVPSPSWPASL